MNTLALVMMVVRINTFCTVETTHINYQNCFIDNFNCAYEVFSAMENENRAINNRVEFAVNYCKDKVN